MDKTKTTGEKILDFLENHSPEKLNARFVDSLEKLSAEAAKELLTERQRGFMEASENWLIGLVILGFICIMYMLFF